MNSLHSFLGIGAYVVQLIVLVIAIIAARRHALKGLWILVFSLLISFVSGVMDLVFIYFLNNIGPNVLLDDVLICAPIAAVLISFLGWFILAFGQK
jgi:4-amino-4-deoxy-L-arabinose transferase-like glycosyltransferase